jgi:crotonobetainyl-CoA:carnitine CoA-transferase CaiB-like acyl-CoA transferase
MLGDPRFTTNADRLSHRDELVPMLESVFVARPREEWLRLLDSADVPTTPVLTLQEALTSDQAGANGTVVELPETEPRLFAAGLPVRAPEWSGPPRRRPPAMGADTADILRGLLGLSTSEIDGLAARDVVGLER